jgi:hypothetical protein
MNRDDVMRMAREAGYVYHVGGTVPYSQFSNNQLQRFANLVAAAEREACAKVCEAEGERVDASWVSCAAAIRARGQG